MGELNSRLGQQHAEIFFFLQESLVYVSFTYFAQTTKRQHILIELADVKLHIKFRSAVL